MTNHPGLDSPSVAAAMLEIADGVSHVLEACSGHRQAALDAGFSDGAAEEMAKHLHHAMVMAMFRGK